MAQTELRPAGTERALPPRTLAQKVVAELVGTAFLLATVVGSGIAATRLTPDDTGAQLLYNSVATGAVLVALILALGPVSAAFNPVVTLVERVLGAVDTRTAVSLVAAQVAGGALGVVLANLMFGLPAVSAATTARSGPGLWLAEVVATFGLVLVVFGVARTGSPRHVAVAVGAYITAAYWFTSSTSFANPAVTLARTLSDSFAGIAPASVAPFVVAQLVGGLLALLTVRLLHHDAEATAQAVASASTAGSRPTRPATPAPEAP